MREVLYARRMAPDPKAVLHLAEQIVDTEARLAKLKAEWEAIFSMANTESAQIARKREGSLASRVEAIVLAEPARLFTIGQVAEELNEDSLKVGRALFQLANNKRIFSPSRGLYRTKPTGTEAA